MQFCIQDPSYTNSLYLHEALLSACKGATSGAGAYAYATADGIDLLLGDASFKSFMENGTYCLIVGMDDITNLNALNALKKYQDSYGTKLTVKVYIHSGKASTFHPKFSWFSGNSGGTLIVGSGNLTERGMRHNREAYGVWKGDNESFNSVTSTWNNWYQHSLPFLFDIDSDAARERAKQNAVNIQAVSKAKKDAKDSFKSSDLSVLTEIYSHQPEDSIKRTSKKKTSASSQSKSTEHQKGSDTTSKDEIDYDSVYWQIDREVEFLVAEIPKSGNRWKQANFDKTTFESYFGATCGENGDYRILLKSISTTGELGATEVRPGVSVSSQNYRFELDAASGLEYPTGNDRPIVVFAKVAQRDFIYELVMPNHPAYSEAINLLDSKKPRSQRMRRITFPCPTVECAIPSLALWSLYE